LIVSKAVGIETDKGKKHNVRVCVVCVQEKIIINQSISSNGLWLCICFLTEHNMKSRYRSHFKSSYRFGSSLCEVEAYED